MKRKFHSNNVEVMEGIKVKDTAKRAIVTVIVFVIIYVLSGPIIGYTNYDMYLKGIEFLSAVIGAGCYWIGSNKKIVLEFDKGVGSMKRIGTALTIVFIIAGFAISFFIGHYVSDKSHTESRAAQFDKYISRAIDTIKDKGLSIDGAPEAIASNIWVAHEFCDSPEISAELSNLWNTIVYEKDVLLGQEDVLTAQLKDILEKCQ